MDTLDAAINIMRRILQSSGSEIIHLGYNRVPMKFRIRYSRGCSGYSNNFYQGGMSLFRKYIYDLLHQRHAGHIGCF